MGKPGPLSSQGIVRRLPSAYRLLPDVERSSLSSIEEGLADRWALREAFRRGATEFDATKLILARLSARRRREAWDAQNVGLGRFALGQRMELQGGETIAFTAVRLESQLFEQEISREFS